MTAPSAVAAADPPDEALAAHYGDPLREQRFMISHGALVDRSNRPVLTISGPDRLSWLHDITSQHVAGLPAMAGTEALVLSPHGHAEHHLMLLDDGETTWIDVEPGTADGLLQYLNAMRFLLRVEVADVSVEWAVSTVVGPLEALPPALTTALVPEASDLPAPVPEQPYPVARLAGGGFARRLPSLGSDGVPVVDLIRPRGTNVVGLAPAGLWAYDALRVEAARPRLGIDTDGRTLPHEVGWIGSAVHLDKGCYRGQETVARVHNLGRPPRRLVALHLDGSVETLPSRGAPVMWRDRAVGFVGTTARHHELGAVALALVKRAVPDDAELFADGVAARIDPELSLVHSEPVVSRDRLRLS